MEDWKVFYGRPNGPWELEDSFETRAAAVKMATDLYEQGFNLAVKVEYSKTVTAMVLTPVEGE